MDLGSITTLANTNSADTVADKLKSNASKLSADSTEDELLTTIKDFESYFVEQVIKQMKDSLTLSDDEEKSTMSQYSDYFMDTAIEQISDEIVESAGQNITQQLYEQMKRNYNL